MKDKSSIWYYISNYKFNSLFIKNFLIIFLAIYLPLAMICLGCYMYFRSVFLTEIQSTSQASLSQVKEIVDTVQTNIIMAGTSLSADFYVDKFLQSEEWTRPSYEEAQNINSVSKTITMATGEYIDSIYILSFRNKYILSKQSSCALRSFYDADWLADYLVLSNGTARWTWGRQMTQPGGKKSTTITTAFSYPFSRWVKNNEGVIVINMSDAWLRQLLSAHSSSEYEFYIVNANGQILYGEDPNGLSADFVDSTGYPLAESTRVLYADEKDDKKPTAIYSCLQSVKTGWYYISVSDMTHYQAKMDGLQKIILPSFVLSFLLAIVVAYLLSVRVFLPIKSIMQMIDDPKAFYDRANNHDSKIRTRYNEMLYITTSFLRSYSKTERAQEELVNYFAQLKRAQVALLQAQINPHFLYNSLQTINFMAISLTRSDNQVSKAIGMLSTMFSNMMRIDSNTTAIEDEIQYSKAYMEMEMLRHKDEFDVVWEIDPQAYNYVTVKFTLQPILENCVKHGFAHMTEKGLIRVSVQVQKDFVAFSISDNGEGQSPQWIEETNAALQEDVPIIGEHIGIRNVHQRIRLIYGKPYGVVLEQAGQGSLCVKILLPLVKKE